MSLFDRIAGHASDLQQSLQKALDAQQETWRPQIQAAVDAAQQLQGKLKEHADQGAQALAPASRQAMEHLGEVLRIGHGALGASTGAAKEQVAAMLDHAKRAGDSIKSGLPGAMDSVKESLHDLKSAAGDLADSLGGKSAKG